MLGKVTEHWRSKLIEASGLIEAELDFADEGDVPGHVLGPVRDLVQAVLTSIDFALASGDAGERLRDGLVVVITGPPNAGKSSLMNRIADRDVAIVSPFKGTTRDVLSVNLELNGYPVELIDTAGIRRTRNPVEQAGIDRAKSVAKKADLVLWLHESKTKRALLPDISGPAPVWKIQAKCDLYPPEGGGNGRRISALDGEGVGELLHDIGKFAAFKLGTGGSSIIVRHRQRRAFADCREALARLVENSGQLGLEVLAEDLRLAIRALGRVIGSVDVEEILGEIFSRFCIGK